MTTKYVPTLGSLASKSLIKAKIVPTDIPEEALEIYRQAWLTSEARLFYIPIIYTPLTKELEDIAYEEIDEKKRYLTYFIRSHRENESGRARETLEHVNSIVLNQIVPQGYQFKKPKRELTLLNLANKIDKNPNNISETLISLLVNNGMKLNRGDIIFYEAASRGLDPWFIIDTHEDLFFLVPLLNGYDFSQPNTMKTITEFPPRYWYKYQITTCYIDTSFFEDQINKNVIEVKDKKYGDFGVTFITYNGITYTIIIGIVFWDGIKKGRNALINVLASKRLKCEKSDTYHPTIKNFFDSNPYTTMMVV